MLSFLLDENLPPSLVPRLKEMGYPARHVVETGHINTDDFEILGFAEHSGEVILTHDTDFGALLALHQKSKPSVVLFRLERISAAILSELLAANLPDLEKALTEGSIVIVEANSIRIRPLPMRR
jgi:predicted nuclease of predicted toxin-antitoxin system